MVVSENPQSKETLQAVESWIELRKERPRDRTGPTSKNRVGNVLRFLGLPYENEQQFTHQDEGSGSRSVHFTFEAGLSAAEGVKGAPLFGSLAKGIYHIFCLWEDARPDKAQTKPNNPTPGPKWAKRCDCSLPQRTYRCRTTRYKA